MLFAAERESFREAALGCRLVARLPDASRKAEEYAALGMFQEAAETAATVSLHSMGGICFNSEPQCQCI